MDRRTSAQSEHRTGTCHLGAPVAFNPSPRKTRSRTRLQEFAKRQANGTQQWPIQCATSSRSHSGEPESPSSQPPQPSPRRLRRRDGQSTGHSSTATAASRPRRKARFEGTFRESSTDEEADELDQDDQEDEDEDDDSGGSARNSDEVDQDDDDDDEEAPVSLMDVDDGATRGRRRKAAQRDARSMLSRSGKRALRIGHAHNPPSDENETEDDEANDTEAEAEELEPEPEPKVLRSGKVLGEALDADDEVEDSSLEAEQSSMETEDVDQLDDAGEAEDGDDIEEDAEEHELGEENGESSFSRIFFVKFKLKYPQKLTLSLRT